MFENPEKLFIILVIALLIFGPSKMAGLGTALGRAIRDFRNAVRSAQDTFTDGIEQATATIEPEAAALPEPAPTPGTGPAREAPGMAVPATCDADAADLDGLSSLASEPTAEALRRSLAGRASPS